jgi:hypothetical protein
MLFTVIKISVFFITAFFWIQTIIMKYKFYNSISSTYLSVVLFKFLKGENEIEKKINKYNLISLIFFVLLIMMQMFSLGL